VHALELVEHRNQGAIACCPGCFASTVKVAGLGQAFHLVKRGNNSVWDEIGHSDLRLTPAAMVTHPQPPAGVGCHASVSTQS